MCRYRINEIGWDGGAYQVQGAFKGDIPVVHKGRRR